MKITEAIDSAAFKHALFEGKVEFDYVKKDGTLRHAVGTMNEAMLPKVEPIVAKFNVVYVEWENDAPYPRKFKIGVTQSEIDEWGADAIDNVVEDAIRRKFNAEPLSFEYYEIDMDCYEKPRKLPAGSVFYYDLDKQAYRSFKLAQLKGWKSC